MVVCFVKIHIRPYMDDIVTLIRVSDPSLSRLLICLLGCMSTSRVLFFRLSPNVEPDTCFHEEFGALYTRFSLTTVIKLYSNRLKSAKKKRMVTFFFLIYLSRCSKQELLLQICHKNHAGGSEVSSSGQQSSGWRFWKFYKVYDSRFPPPSSVLCFFKTIIHAFA